MDPRQLYLFGIAGPLAVFEGLAKTTCAGQIVGGPFAGWIGLIGAVRTALYAGALALLPAIGLLGMASARMKASKTPLAESVDTVAETT